MKLDFQVEGIKMCVYCNGYMPSNNGSWTDLVKDIDHLMALEKNGLINYSQHYNCCPLCGGSLTNYEDSYTRQQRMAKYEAVFDYYDKLFGL